MDVCGRGGNRNIYLCIPSDFTFKEKGKMARNNRFVNLNIFEHVEDEEDDELFGTRRPYTIRVRRDHLDIWDDLDFRCRFRLKKKL